MEVLRPTMLPYGKPTLSFPDQAALGWAALVLGLSVLLAGVLLTILLLTQGTVGAATGDALAGLCFLALLWLFGIGLSYACVRDLLGKPTWHVSSTHVWRTRGSKVIVTVELAQAPEATVVDSRRRGHTMWFSVRLGGQNVITPSRDVAYQIAGLWRRARGA
jgi:hypothetical protein